MVRMTALVENFIRAAAVQIILSRAHLVPNFSNRRAYPHDATWHAEAAIAPSWVWGECILAERAYWARS